MNRRSLLKLACTAFASATGCFGDFHKKAHDGKVSQASVNAAQRVDELSKRILEQNTFTGIEPIMRVIGVPESVLFHRGQTELFISEGLVKKCKTEAELAAVLCTELGKMMAQKRAAIAVGRNLDPIPTVALPPGSSDSSMVREAELALQKRREDQRKAAEQSGEATLAKELLTGAGFDPAEFDRVQGMVKLSERGEAIKKQLAGPAASPVWNK